MTAPRIIQPLGHRDFRLVWLGESTSVIGDHFHYVALAWLTLQLTESGLALGTVLMATAIPRALLMLIGGAVTDRFSSRNVMLTANLLRGALTTLVAALVWTEAIELWHLYATAVGFGVAGAFFYPAMQSITPSLVPEERLPAANALIEGTRNLGTLVGPTLGGLAVAFAGAGLAFAINAASFWIASACLLLVRPSAPRAEKAIEGGVLSAVAAGLRYVWRDQAIRTLVAIIAVTNLAFNGPILVGLAWLADMRFDDGPVGLGVMLTAFGGGALLGTIAAGSLPRPRNMGLVLVVEQGALGIGLALIGLLPGTLTAAGVLGLIGLGSGYINVLVLSWLHARAEPAMLGRLMSLVMLAAMGLAPVSYAVAGFVVDDWATLMFAIAGAMVVLTALVGGLVWNLPARMEREPVR